MNRFREPSDVTAFVAGGAQADLTVTLESLFEQSHPPDQIIVVGSTAHPYRSLVTSLTWDSPDVRRVLVSTSRLYRTPYIMAMAAGDRIHSTAVEALELVLDVRQDVDWVCAFPSNAEGSSRHLPGALYRRDSLLTMGVPNVIALLDAEAQQRLLDQGGFYRVPHSLGQCQHSMELTATRLAAAH